MARPHPSLFALAAGQPMRIADDSEELVRSAIEHRMDGLLWSAIRDDAAALDESARAELARRSLSTRSRHRAMEQVLARCTATLADLGIDVATFKGVTAEARWYDHPGDRPCADVDLLLAPHHHHRIGDVVTALEPTHVLAADVRSLVSGGQLQSVELRVDGVAIDVHLDLFKLGVPSRQRAEIWTRTQVMHTAHGDVRVLDPETALVHFLVHLNKDRFRWLLGYVDVVRVLDRETLDWAAIEGIAAADGLVMQVALSLACVTDALGRERAPLRPPHGWRSAAWRRLWRPTVRLQGDVGLVGFHLRQATLPVLADGRALEAVRASARRVVPHPTLVRYRNPGVSGGYVRRLTTGRIARTIERRRAVRRLRRVGHPDRSSAVTATPERD